MVQKKIDIAKKKAPAGIPLNWKEFELGKLLEFKNGINAGKESYGSGVKFINVMEVIYNDAITSDIIPGSVVISDEQKELYLVKNGLWKKLPDWMEDKQRKIKINNLLAELRLKNKIRNVGTLKGPKWVLIKNLS
jgi:hypothetical protein